MSLITLRDVAKFYDDGGVVTRALDGVSFSIEKGEFVAIMGPSGSGKSTLLHIMGFLDRPTSGHYLFEGKDINTYADEELARARNRRMGFVFQAFNLLPRTSVLENVKLPLFYADKEDGAATRLAKEAIEAVGLTPRIAHSPAELSGGERQRVAIARALVGSPSVIFADEPTGNLDSKSGENIMSLIQELNQRFKHTIVLVTHDNYAATYAKRILHIRDGKLETDTAAHKKSHES